MPKKKRLSGDRAALGVTQMQAYYQVPSLGGGTGVSAVRTGGKARTDPQGAYPASKKKAKAAVAASRARYEKWKKARGLEVCTKTGKMFMRTALAWAARWWC